MFLDTEVIQDGNSLVTDLYTKHAHTHQYRNTATIAAAIPSTVRISSASAKPSEYVEFAAGLMITTNEWGS